MEKSKILIVEDERITAGILKNILEFLGYEVLGIASSADAFYEILQAGKPDLVLMDIYLNGDKDGIELASEIKASHQLAVIYLTAFSDTHLLERAKVTEPFGYILKPFQERELHSNIEMALFKNKMEKRINHLNAILKSIREVNQLIVKENNPRDLIHKTCDILITSRAYSSAWLMLVDEKGDFQEAASVGFSDQLEVFVSKMKDGYKPQCLAHLNKKAELIYTSTDWVNCADCPMHNLSHEQGTLIAKIQYQTRTYGYLAVSMPQEMIGDKEEQDLFIEISGDLGLALNNLEHQKKKLESKLALAESETLFRHAFDFASTSMAIIAMDGNIIKANAALARLTNYSEEELRNMHMSALNHPEDTDTGPEFLGKLITGDLDTKTFEKRFITRNGKIIRAYISVSLVRDELYNPKYFISHIIDLTDIRIAEQDLIDSEKQYRTFINSTTDIVYLKDDQLRYVMVNTVQQQFFGKPENEICGMTDFQLMPQDDALHCSKSDLEVLQNKKMIITTEAFGNKYYETRKFPVSLKTGKTGVGAFIRDVTEQKQSEEAVHRKTVELERMNAFMVDRELKMIDLKKEINELMITSGKQAEYRIVE